MAAGGRRIDVQRAAREGEAVETEAILGTRGRSMNICLLGYENLPVLAPEYSQHGVGGEPVQQTLLARALAKRGHDVSMVVLDYGQRDGCEWDGIRTYRAFRPQAGMPVLRFIHPRWTGTWSALARANADVYYTSCAGMHVGLVAMFCHRHRKRFVFRTASDADCDRSRVRTFVRFARDRWLYAYGLRRADAVLVQSITQARTLARSFSLASRVAGMLVEQAQPCSAKEIDVLWVGNIKQVKRPDRVLDLALKLPHVRVHVVGGPTHGEEALFQHFARAAATRPNLVFHGPLSYRDTNRLYDRARVLVNTSDVEGFPNVYLQAWVRGVPVVTLIDPDGVIAREGLGIRAGAPELVPAAVRSLLVDTAAWQAASERCRAFMDQRYGEDAVLADYLGTFAEVLRGGCRHRSILAASEHHV
jgi:glycosyltransferase involved in cell wall biosynthesis